MPNHTFHSMEISGDPAQLEQFVAKHFNDEEFNLDSIIPMPEELRGTTSPPKEPNPEFVKQFGADNWYDWCVKNWNTKWNCYSCTMDFSDKEIICATFQTAWNTIEPIFHKLGELYPELTFCVEIVDEGGYFGGTIDVVTGEVIVDLTEDKWKEYAIRLTGYEDHEEEENKERIILAIEKLKVGEITDLGVVNVMANFVKSNLDDFIEYSK